MPATMLSPVPSRQFSCPSGNVYLADQFGVVSGVKTSDDVTALQVQGLVLLTPPPSDLLGKLLQADFNVTTDQQIVIPTLLKYRPKKIVVTNTSVAGMSTAVGGIYTGAGKTGTQIVANTQIYTGLTNALTALELTLNAPTAVLPSLTTLYFALTTPQGAVAKADIYVFGEAYPTTP